MAAADKTIYSRKFPPPPPPTDLHSQHSQHSAGIDISTTMTLSTLPGKPNKKGVSLAPERERYMQACADVAHHLIQLHEEDNGGKDVNLNALRGQISKKYKLKMIPPLTAIIAAIPEHYKKYIVPKLIAKPIRMFL